MVLLLNFDCLFPEYQCPKFLTNNLYISYRKWGIFIDLSSIVLFLKIPSKNENLVCNKNKKNISINAMLKNKILALSLEVHCWALNPSILGQVKLGSIRIGEGGCFHLKCFLWCISLSRLLCILKNMYYYVDNFWGIDPFVATPLKGRFVVFFK